MFYDLEEPMRFVADIKEILHPEGIWIFEQSYMPKMLETNSFDTICHEHLEYYALKQIEWMLEKNGLKVFDIDFNNSNGGSFRVYACHKDSPRLVDDKKIHEIKNYEKALGLENINPFEEFKKRVIDLKNQAYNFLTTEKLKGKKVHVYGASTKGNVLLNFFGIHEYLVDAASDKNPDKWARVTPGSRIPIISEEESRKAKPDYYLVLPWHFKQDFLEREHEFMNNGGKFIFPLPKFEVVGKS